jgi:hypothetical protein
MMKKSKWKKKLNFKNYFYNLNKPLFLNKEDTLTFNTHLDEYSHKLHSASSIYSYHGLLLLCILYLKISSIVNLGLYFITREKPVITLSTSLIVFLLRTNRKRINNKLAKNEKNGKNSKFGIIGTKGFKRTLLSLTQDKPLNCMMPMYLLQW